MRAIIEKFDPRELGPKPWGTELLVAHTPHYTGKCLSMRAGTSGPFQYHERKDETFFLFSGSALVTWKDSDGCVRHTRMEPGEAYHVPPGAPHQVAALTDCVFFEASTPVFDDRVPVNAHATPNSNRVSVDHREL